jgi:hypothetical protein
MANRISRSTAVARLIAAALMFTITAASINSVHAMPKQQKTSASSIVSKKNQEKKKAAKQGKIAAKARKEITGRDHQGNHDSLTKPEKSGPKGDKHAKGIRQAGAAGTKPEKSGSKGDHHEKGSTQAGAAGSSKS